MANDKKKAPKAPKPPKIIPPSVDEELMVLVQEIKPEPPSKAELSDERVEYADLVRKMHNSSADIHYAFYKSNGDNSETAYQKTLRVFGKN